MIRASALALTLALAWSLGGPLGGSLAWIAAAADQPSMPGSSARSETPPAAVSIPPPGTAERWLVNPRERTDAARQALAGGGDRVVEPLDTALRLAPDEPRTLYNAGTGRLLTDAETDRAVELLGEAARIAPPELAPHALYNLGNARLDAGDPAAAATAYRDALRLDPDFRAAKHNLEVALARLDRERERTQQPRPPSPEREKETDGSEESPPPGRSDEERDEQRPETPPDGEQGADQNAAPRSQGTGPPESSTARLPRFEEQEDMTAAQAAALLEAIESLEREQRRMEAAERAERAGKAGEKDW